MTVQVEPIFAPVTKSAVCARLIAQLPKWFGRPQANAFHVNEIVDKDVFAACVDGIPQGLIALDFHFDATCEVWILAVSPEYHRRGLGRMLVERAETEACNRGCRFVAVQTVGPRAASPEYDLTRRFYEALEFAPLVAFEPKPGDYMMWMVRSLPVAG